MKVKWRKSAIQSLLELDRWRITVELSPIARYLKDKIHEYFLKQDLSIHVLGRPIIIREMPVDLRVVLLSMGKSGPYKIFYRSSGDGFF